MRWIAWQMVGLLTGLGLLCGAGLIALAPLAAPAQAQGGDALLPPEAPEQVLQSALIAGWRSPEGALIGALHLRLAPGWKTYWRAPGTAGIAPRFDWEGSSNLAQITYHWPAPELFLTGDALSAGYREELVLPIELLPQDPAKPIKLRGVAEIGLCKDLCLPAQLPLSGTFFGPAMPEEPELPPIFGPKALIAQALEARPATAQEAGLSEASCLTAPIEDGLRITARMRLPPLGAQEMVAFEPALPGIWVAPSPAQREGDWLTAQAEMVPPEGRPFALSRARLTITVIGSGGRAVQMQGCPAPN